MAHIIKKSYTKHQLKYPKKYGVKGKHFYLVKNRANETIKGFTSKSKAKAYSKKRRGI